MEKQPWDREVENYEADDKELAKDNVADDMNWLVAMDVAMNVAMGVAMGVAMNDKDYAVKEPW